MFVKTIRHTLAAAGDFLISSVSRSSNRTKPIAILGMLTCWVLAGCGGGAASDIVPKWPINNTKQVVFAEDDWPGWRGGSHQGIATGPAAPIKWSDKENIVWSAEIPGRGHSSPVVIGNQIYLTTSDEVKKTQNVICLQRKTGNQAWMTRVHAGGLDSYAHYKNTQATPTVVCDLERVFALFMFDSRVQLTALDLSGNILWTTIVGPYRSKYGYSSSPLLYGPLVIIAVDHEGGGYLAGVNRYTGDIHWRTSRPPVDSYGNPAIHKVAGKDTLFIAGGGELAAYEPLTGKRLWGIKGLTEACVGSPVESNQTIIASGGYPGSETLAVKIMENGQPVVTWRSSTKSYVPSLLAYNGLLFQVTDGGNGSCWDVESGDMYWQSRLGGDFSSSPVLSGENVYISNEAGVTQVFKASKEKFELVSRNKLGDEQMASPAICGGRIYIRAASTQGEGKRVETLYCIGTGGVENKTGENKTGGDTVAVRKDEEPENPEPPSTDQDGKAQEQAPK